MLGECSIFVISSLSLLYPNIYNILHKHFLSDHVLLQRYLKVSDNKLADAFALLKDGLELRKRSPDLFTNRDLMSKEIQTTFMTL